MRDVHQRGAVIAGEPRQHRHHREDREGLQGQRNRPRRRRARRPPPGDRGRWTAGVAGRQFHHPRQARRRSIFRGRSARN